MLKSILVSLFIITLFGQTCAQSFQTVSYNIRYNNPEDGADNWMRRKEAVAETIFNPENDIIGLQEVLYGQMHYLQGQPEAANFDSWGYGRDDGLYEGEFSPIFFNNKRFTRYIGEMKWLSETPDTPSVGWDAACKRIVTIANLICCENGRRVTVLNTHFDHEGKVARENSVKIIADLVRKYEAHGDAVLVLGDFNTTPRDPILKPLKKMLADACPRKWRRKSTFNAFKEKAERRKHIDYIWYSKTDFQSSNYAILAPKTKTGRQASDHFMVKTTLEFIGTGQ
jgi:endonuclease/exonuclease/phosphatase family metal-dependent hydrolase